MKKISKKTELFINMSSMFDPNCCGFIIVKKRTSKKKTKMKKVSKALLALNKNRSNNSKPYFYSFKEGSSLSKKVLNPLDSINNEQMAEIIDLNARNQTIFNGGEILKTICECGNKFFVTDQDMGIKKYCPDCTKELPKTSSD